MADSIEKIKFFDEKHHARLIDVLQRIDRLPSIDREIAPDYAAICYLLSADPEIYNEIKTLLPSAYGTFNQFGAALIKLVETDFKENLLVRLVAHLFNHDIVAVTVDDLFQLDDEYFNVCLQAIRLAKYGCRLSDIKEG